MKTSVIEVHDMLSVLSVDEVEGRIGAVPGVESATVNFAAGSATVRYDETRLEVSDIKSAVRQRGYDSVAPTTSVTSDSASAARQDKAAPLTAPTSASAPLAAPPEATPDSGDLASNKQEDQAASDKI